MYSIGAQKTTSKFTLAEKTRTSRGIHSECHMTHDLMKRILLMQFMQLSYLLLQLLRLTGHQLQVRQVARPVLFSLVVAELGCSKDSLHCTVSTQRYDPTPSSMHLVQSPSIHTGWTTVHLTMQWFYLARPESAADNLFNFPARRRDNYRLQAEAQFLAEQQFSLLHSVQTSSVATWTYFILCSV
jgi:hypothetical protein